MGAIAATEARSVFTKTLVDAYRERISPMSFLRSFFKNKETTTKNVSIEVQRGTEKVAVDVVRGTEGNRNTISRTTEKVIEPPYFREYFDITKLDLYDRMFGSTTIDASVVTQFTEDVADKLVMLTDKIERAYELQCAQVLETGIVTVRSGTNIDFLRKAGSLIDNSGTPWSTGATDPYAQLQAGGDFLRQVGKAQGGIINGIFGSSALAAFLNNTTVKARGPLSNVNLDVIHAPQRNSIGATLSGVVTAGPYQVYIWSYPEFYDDANGTSTPYINPKKVILLPQNPRFTMAFGAVPQLIDPQNPTITKGAYIFGNFPDQRKAAHDFDVQSAGIAIPVAVDQIVTMQVLA